MPGQVTGYIDISPPLTWAEVAPTGWFVMNSEGVPEQAIGDWVGLPVTATIEPHADGTLTKYTFDRMVAKTPDMPTDDRFVFKGELQGVINTFPTHAYGNVSQIIDFRGDLWDDRWRVGLGADPTLILAQVASLVWTDV